MRFRVSAVVLGLGALAATPCLALTIQTAPPRPDVAQHLRSSPASTPSAFTALPAPDDLKDSFAASGRAQLGQGFVGQANGGTSSFSFGPLRGTTTLVPGYGAYWNGRRDGGNPYSLVPPRP